jgi:hypothetical protein
MLLAEELLSDERDEEELDDGKVTTLDELRLVATALDERLVVIALDDTPELTIP